VKIIKYDRNLGFGVACNRAIKKTESDYIVLLNNDIEVEEKWLAELVDSIHGDNDVAAATSKIFFLRDRNRINSCGGMIDKYGFALNRGNGETDFNSYDSMEEVFYAVGTAMIIRRSVWNKIGEFDEDYFAYFEDLDWSWRARLNGYKILYVPKSIVYHFWRGSFSRRDHVIYYYTKNRLATLIKNYSLWYILKVLPIYFTICCLELLWIAIKWNGYDLLAFIKAFLWNLKNFKSILHFRYKIQSRRIVSDGDVQRFMRPHSFELRDVLCKNADKILNHPFLNQK
jgi:GT2 family glycosyltransferase